MSNAINRILGQGTREARNTENYQAFVDSGGRPQMSFVITRANGMMYGFSYHAMSVPRYDPRDGEIISFSEGGVAVALQGTGIKVIFLAMMRRTLMEIREYDGRPIEDGAPRVTRLEVVDTNEEAAEPSRPQPRRGTARLVK
jgi:hypothetical protein